MADDQPSATGQRDAAAERSASTGNENRGRGHHEPTQVPEGTLEQAIAGALALRAGRARRGHALPEELLVEAIFLLRGNGRTTPEAEVIALLVDALQANGSSLFEPGGVAAWEMRHKALAAARALCTARGWPQKPDDKGPVWCPTCHGLGRVMRDAPPADLAIGGSVSPFKQHIIETCPRCRGTRLNG